MLCFTEIERGTSLDKEFEQLTSDLQQASGGHLVYLTQNQELYIKKVVSFILSGIEEGSHIICIENDRIYPSIYQNISKKLTSSQLKKILHVNNFDFYWSTGNFDIPSIVAYFSKILIPFLYRQNTCSDLGTC